MRVYITIWYYICRPFRPSHEAWARKNTWDYLLTCEGRRGLHVRGVGATCEKKRATCEKKGYIWVKKGAPCEKKRGYMWVKKGLHVRKKWAPCDKKMGSMWEKKGSMWEKRGLHVRKKGKKGRSNKIGRFWKKTILPVISKGRDVHLNDKDINKY